ncbi:uncharacterized protein TNCV_4965491 [Trichonephila clavipes]|nr:uncharacterized protein TNCV_4965491 [Trichonephila clavipes]
MPRRRIQAHYKQLSEFERDHIIGLKEAVTNLASNCVLTIIEDVYGDDQGSMPILLSLLRATQALNQKLWSGVPFLFTVGLLWSSLKHIYITAVRQRHSENCFATVPFTQRVPLPYFQQDNARPHTARVFMNCLAASQTLPCYRSQIARSLSNQTSLGYDGKATASGRAC